MPRDTSIATYRARRDFSRTAEPAPKAAPARPNAPIFVVQKHAAHRAGLHWDFRLEHRGVLWSWAVPKGPSLDPAHKRMAIHVEDHPLDYATFEGTIPAGSYGAGDVTVWDHGTWHPLGDPDKGMQSGELRFTLDGTRLHGRFTLARLARRDPRKPEAWFLIKGHDEAAREGIDALALEKDVSPPPPAFAAGPGAGRAAAPPASGAVSGTPPPDQSPQLCRATEDPPADGPWISELKFDGYRLLAWKTPSGIRLVTRNGHDWADRLPALARAVEALPAATCLLDGELVAMRPDGTSSFPDLQAALSAGQDRKLHFYAFDLLALNGWDLRPARLLDRKAALRPLIPARGMIRYSDHLAGDTATIRRQACGMKLEGIIAKRPDAPYTAGRGPAWLKLKCLGREEFIILGWTPPAGSRTGIGALHLGYHDRQGRLHYAGGAGSGFSEAELKSLRRRLGQLDAPRPGGLLAAGDPLDPAITWVRPELVAEIQFTAWSGSGRVRHAVFLGLREDKDPAQVVRDPADPEAERAPLPEGRTRMAAKPRTRAAIPPVPAPAAPPPSARIVSARAPRAAEAEIAGVRITHPDRELWPGITKRDLAAYWQAVAGHALPGIAHRPLALVRCPEGIAGEHFFQKHGHGHLPPGIREASAAGAPYLAIDDAAGLAALAQLSAIEIHPWGAPEADPTHPDFLVFDLDPGAGVPFPDVVAAAAEVRRRLAALRLAAFCRTSGGKGLHVVVPLVPSADWDTARRFCRAFAETMATELPDRFLAHVKIADRKGRILVDWLRNGLGATAIASFCPRARPGAPVATPLAWREVTAKLDPAAFTIATVPARLARLRKDPWDGFDAARQPLPALTASPPRGFPGGGRGEGAAPTEKTTTSRIITAAKPKRRH